MKRYGDNLPSSSASEDEPNSEHGGDTMVMYGGCGVSFGAFPKPAEHPNKKNKTLNLLPLLGFKRDQRKKESG